MADFLLVSAEDPVNSSASIDGSGALQVNHSSDCLVDYSQTLHAEHDDLIQSTGTIRLKLFDLTSGGVTWQMAVVHDSNNWSRGTDHAYYDFGPLTSEVEVDITATSNESPPAVKTRTIWVKTKPTDGQPDDPEFEP